MEQVNTIADGIAVKSPGEKTFEIIDKYVDEIVTVTEGEIVDAFLLLSEKHKLLWPLDISTMNINPLLEQTPGYDTYKKQPE